MKIKSFVGLNEQGDSFSLTKDKLPDLFDEVYFTLTYQKSHYNEYHKGIYIENNFYTENKSYSLKEVVSWCLVDDPTAIQRLIFSFDLDFYFDAADWERTNINGVIYDEYPNGPCAVDIKELELSKQTEILLKNYIDFVESQGSFNCKDPIVLHNVNQMGLFIYEELRKELINKCYLIYCPIPVDNNKTNFPMMIDNNKDNFSWINPNNKLPELNKEIYFQLDSFTGEFKKGILVKRYNNFVFVSYENNNVFEINKVCRWQYVNN